MTSDTPHWTDEQLSAFLDGALDDATTEQLALALEHDGDLAARLMALEEANRAVQQAFDAPMHEPIPERLRAIVEAGLRPEDAPKTNIVDLAERRRPRAAPPPWQVPISVKSYTATAPASFMCQKSLPAPVPVIFAAPTF